MIRAVLLWPWYKCFICAFSCTTRDRFTVIFGCWWRSSSFDPRRSLIPICWEKNSIDILNGKQRNMRTYGRWGGCWRVGVEGCSHVRVLVNHVVVVLQDGRDGLLLLRHLKHNMESDWLNIHWRHPQVRVLTKPASTLTHRSLLPVQIHSQQLTSQYTSSSKQLSSAGSPQSGSRKISPVDRIQTWIITLEKKEINKILFCQQPLSHWP